MIICSCNVLSDATIRAALDSSDGRICPRTPGAVYKCLGCSPNCGRCFVTVRQIIKEALAGMHAHPHEHPHAPAAPRAEALARVHLQGLAPAVS